MDAMVTARMPAGKKAAGAEVLDSIGMSASQLINEVWDQLISRRRNPLEPQSEQRSDREQRVAEAYAWVDSLASAAAKAAFSEASDDEIFAMHAASVMESGDAR